MAATLRRMAIGSGLVLLGLFVAPHAGAQVPAVPELPATPELPPEVVDAIAQAEDVIVPVLLQGATAAEPAANAVGFGLRPACSAVAFPLVLVIASGGDLPISPGGVLTPYFLMCGAASTEGPADAVFAQVDQAAGSQLEAAVDPVLDQVHDAVITPIRPNLNDACGAMAVIGTAPNQVPAPLSRFDMTEVLCGT